MDYFGARYYESLTGRWLQVDPLNYKYLDLSPYSYCANNPLLLIDPDGKDWLQALGHVLSAIANAKQVLGGVVLTGVAGTTEGPSGGTSTFTLALGIENIGHGAVGFGLNVWNGSIEATRSVMGNENAFSKIPANGFFELVANEMGANKQTVSKAKLLDIMNTLIGSGYDPGTIGSYDFQKLIDIFGDVNTAKDIIETMKEIEKADAKKKEEERKKEKKKDEETQNNQ